MMEKEEIAEKELEGITSVLIPSGKLVSEIFGIIFILVLLLSIFSGLNFGSANLSLEIGWPWAFLYLKEDYSNSSPLNILNLVFDLAIYLAISYILAVIFTTVLNFFKKKFSK